VGRVLLTGVAGFVGSHVGEALRRSQWTVRGVDAFTDTYSPRQKWENLAALMRRDELELVTADLARADLAPLLEDVDAVVHLAGEPGVPSSWGSGFATYVDRNITATQRLLEAATAAGVSRFVYASSSSVYGPEPGRLHESAAPRPLSPYGASKLAAECLVGAYAQQRGLSTVSLRYFSVYGPRQRPDMAAHRFTEALLDDRPIPVFGDGGQARDFTYVDDVVRATVAAVTAPCPPGSVLNIAHGEPVLVRDLIAMLAELTGRRPRLDVRPERPGDTPRTEGDASAARAALGWEATTDVATGLARQVAWHLGRRPARPRLPEPAAVPAPELVPQPAASGPPGSPAADGLLPTQGGAAAAAVRERA
jgi:UDP-glucuronate 4-epimerase